MNMNNILIDFTQIPLQKVGVGVYAKETFKRIVNKDKDNNYYCIIQNDDNELINLFQSQKIIKVNSKIFRYFIFRVLLEQFYIPFLCLKYKIDIIHSLHYSFPIMKLSKTKRIVVVHDLTFFIYPKMHTLIKRYYFKIFIKLACKYSDAIICVSKSTKNDLFRYVSNIKSEVHVIPLAANITTNYSVIDVKNKYSIKKDYLLFIGTLEPRKNITQLIKAYSNIKDKEKLQLVIVGKKGWYYKEIFNLVDQLSLNNDIIFTGFASDEDKFALLENCYIFIYPSVYEGFGLPVLEAITLGVPTITSNVSSMPEVVEDSAIKINPLDVNDIIKAIDLLSQDDQLRENLSKKGKTQSMKYSWDITAKETVSLYNNILK